MLLLLFTALTGANADITKLLTFDGASDTGSFVVQDQNDPVMYVLHQLP